MSDLHVNIARSERAQLSPIGQQSTATTKREIIGLVIIGASGLARLFVKIGGSVFPSSQIVFARSVVQVTLCLVGFLWLNVHPFSQREGRKWVLFRGLVGALSLILYYYSLLHIQFADAAVIMNLQTIFAATLAAVLLKEPFGCFERLCLTVCLAGAILVTKPSFLFKSTPGNHGGSNPIRDGDKDRSLAIFAALTGAVLSATAFVVVRATGKPISLILSTVFFQDFRKPEDMTQYAILGLTGLFAFIGQAMVNLGLQMAPAGIGTLICTIEVVYAFIYGILLFHEYPDILSVVGAVIIITSVVGVGWKKWKYEQPA
ncbi:hypothetical protein BJV82DRAFT_642393 [Fennellomyces sp. T-0311]|nr:hypothetical protein BJV82DRAFT_642393 [Fennellomyces sp. T-0311]